ncbi:hypothetical protein Tco_0321163 [Tanacetum coccineum]
MNFHKTTPESLPTPSSSPSRITSSHSLSSEPSTEPIFEPQPSPDAEYHVPSPNESPLHDVHSYGSDEGSLKLNELTNLVTKLSERIGSLKSRDGKARKRARIVISKDEEDDSSKQGRIDEDLNTYFAQDDEVVHDQDTAEEGQQEDSTAGITVSTAPINISTARETHSTAGRVVYGRRSKEARKDKGKAIITEPEPEKKSKKLLEQERLDLEEAIRCKTSAQFLKRVWGFLHNFVPMDLEIEMEKKKSAEFQEIEEEQIEKDTSKKIQDK